MGRVEISLSVNGDKAVANFVSANPAVREALEAAMPRLREVLADAGIQLGQTQVGAENAHQSAQQDKNGDNFAFGRNARLDADGALRTGAVTQPAPAMLKKERGLVDIFA
jgi:flagellar hook-length control protein FliK